MTKPMRVRDYQYGRSRVRFKTVSAADTPICMKELVELYNNGIEEGKIPPLVLLATFNLDFLCIQQLGNTESNG